MQKKARVGYKSSIPIRNVAPCHDITEKSINCRKANQMRMYLAQEKHERSKELGPTMFKREQKYHQRNPRKFYEKIETAEFRQSLRNDKLTHSDRRKIMYKMIESEFISEPYHEKARKEYQQLQSMKRSGNVIITKSSGKR